ncbi:hypothetical protein N9153_03660, partial [Planctomicrobium sp.]|nr:hypothetical protein [bacterium]MDB4440001.1 hypothetical protein [Planctomicrobium sp.]
MVAKNCYDHLIPNYHRAYIPGGTFFFTVVTYGRRPLFQYETATEILGDANRECKQRFPFEINAIVHARGSSSLHLDVAS